MSASIKFDQAGLSVGVNGKSRSDGLATGAVVTVTNAGGGPCTCEFLWKPPTDTAATLVQVSPTQWQFTPQASRYGDYIVRLTETSTNTIDDKAFGVRLPNSGLLPVGFNAVGDRTVHLNSTLGDKATAALSSTHNETVTGFDWTGWWPYITELFYYVDTLTVGTGTSTADTEIIWRPGFGGTSSIIFSTFSAALSAALQASGNSRIILDPSLSSTFNLPDSVQDLQSRVLIEGPRLNGLTANIVFNTNSEILNGKGLEINSDSVVTLSSTVGGPNTTFFNQSNYQVGFTFSGNIARSGGGGRYFWKDTSVGAPTTTPRNLYISNSLWTASSNMFGTINALTVHLSGPNAMPAAADIFTASGTVALVVNVAAGTGYSATSWQSWTGPVTVNRRAIATSISTDSPVAANWPEGSPAQVMDALAKLAARITVVESFVNPIVFNRDKWMFVTGGAGTLNLQLAGSGHSTAVETTVRIWILATASYTGLTVDAAFGQDGNPVATFDQNKGYHVYITRVTDGTNVTFAVSSKVVTN